jgi:hypothetical protein
MKKTNDRKTLPLRRERIRALTSAEASKLAGGTGTDTAETLTTVMSILLRCIPQTQPQW